MQVGTHDELINITGKYSEMWNAQRGNHEEFVAVHEGAYYEL